jgi:F-box and WD-40 domain protein CDC4
MTTYECVQQISAHDNSVTCLQFDDRRMLSCGNDGKVRLWDLKGRLIRNFSTPGKTVWKLQFNDTKAVVLKQVEQPERHTVMEVHDFDVDVADDGDNTMATNRSLVTPLPTFPTSNPMLMEMD